MYPIQWDTGVYASRAEFAKDVQQAYKDAIQAFYDAGCRYLQFDDVYWGSLCNNHLKPEFEADKAQALENIQAVLADKPADYHPCLSRELPFHLLIKRCLRPNCRCTVCENQLRWLFLRIR